MQRKGQEFNAAILIAIIAALIIIYLLFLPVEDRKDLLDQVDETSGRSSPDSIELLKEPVGRLDPSEKIEDKGVPNVFLFETTESTELTSLNPVYVRNGVFDKKSKTVSCGIDSLENLDNVFLTFTASQRKGILMITLNDNVIYDFDLNKLNVDPIRNNKEYLHNDNVVEFSVSGVGWRFWTTNEYSLENIKIIGDITDKSRQESRNIFTLTDTELQNIESAELQFIPYCTVNEAGILDVFVNNFNVYSALPVCDDPVEQNVPPTILNEGSNKVIFKTTKGSYSIEQIAMQFKQKDTISTVYYFDINETTCEDIIDKHIKLTIEFVDDEDQKRADVNINGHLQRIDQSKKLYEKNVEDWIVEDDSCIENNFIKITPKETLDIVEILVVAQN